MQNKSSFTVKSPLELHVISFTACTNESCASFFLCCVIFSGVCYQFTLGSQKILLTFISGKESEQYVSVRYFIDFNCAYHLRNEQVIPFPTYQLHILSLLNGQIRNNQGGWSGCHNFKTYSGGFSSCDCHTQLAWCHTKCFRN